MCVCVFVFKIQLDAHTRAPLVRESKREADVPPKTTGPKKLKCKKINQAAKRHLLKGRGYEQKGMLISSLSFASFCQFLSTFVSFLREKKTLVVGSEPLEPGLEDYDDDDQPRQEPCFLCS
jgi:hypothetical protein